MVLDVNHITLVITVTDAGPPRGRRVLTVHPT